MAQVVSKVVSLTYSIFTVVCLRLIKAGFFRCQVCEKRFSRSDHLAKHLKVHRRDRLYSYLASIGYGTPSRRGRISQNILNNDAVKNFIDKENIVL